MPREEYVVQYNETTDLFMTIYNPQFSQCEWGTIENPSLLIWETLEEAQQIAAGINSGTVGTVKPS